MPYKDKEAKRAYQKKWIAARRRKWLAKCGPCSVCGSRKNLELDHLDQTTKVGHKIWSWSDERREAEIAKCRVLCSRCHWVRHGHKSMGMYYMTQSPAMAHFASQSLIAKNSGNA